jgi:hypothetical protein
MLGVKMTNVVAYQYRPSRLKKAIYYCHRVVVNPFLRACVIRVLGWWIGMRSTISEDLDPLLASLKEDGIVHLGQVLTEIQCAEIQEYLSDKPVYDRNISLERAFSDAQPADMAFGIHLLKDVLNCPHIIETVNRPEILQLAAEYLGCNPTLSCLGVQWSFPTNGPRIAQQFHRDSEDWKYLRFIVYLTDVVEGCGPHVYIEGSHRDALPFRMKFYPPEELSQRYGNDRFIKVFGKPGTAIAADTSGIHKGELPTTKPRLVLNFTFAILPNILSEYEPLHTRHSAQFINYTNRLFLR